MNQGRGKAGAGAYPRDLMAGAAWAWAHPVEWAEKALGARLDPVQVKAIEAVRDCPRLDLKSGNGVGKTYSAAVIALWFLYSRIPSTVVITASTDRQLWRQFWPELKRLWYEAKVDLPGRLLEKYLSVDDRLKWFCLGFSTKEEAKFEGFHNKNVLLIFDEAKGIGEDIWRAGERLLRGKGMHRWLACGTPPLAPVGEFCQVSLDPRKAALWKHLQMSAWDSPRVSREACQAALDTYGKDNPFYASMVLGQIPKQSDDALISIQDVEEAANLDATAGPLRAVGVDVSRKGEDKTVITLNLWPKFIQFKHPGTDKIPWTTTRIKEAIASYPNAREVPINCDDSVRGDVPVIIRRQGRWIDIVPIESLHKKDSLIYRGHTGLEVLSQDGWTAIVNSRRHRVAKMLYDVVTVDGRTVVTGDHSLMVSGVEAKAHELARGTVIDTKRLSPESPTADISDGLAWALGLFAAEGSLSWHQRNHHLLGRIANSDPHLLLKAQEIFEQHFCQARNIGKAYRGVASLRIADEATRFIERWAYTTVNIRTWEVGKGRKTILRRHKKVPIQIINGPLSAKIAWLKGYLAGDGTYDRGHVKVDSIDLSLIAGVQYLWESIGYETGVGIRDDKPTVTTLRKLGGFVDGRKTRRLPDGTVKRVRELGVVDGFVYDLETASHTFVAGLGFLVHHNSGVGGGVTDELEAEGYNAIPCNFGGKANDEEHYYDFGTEMYATLGKLFKARQISIPNDPLLKAQLYQRTMVEPRRKGGKWLLKLLSKPEMRKHKLFKGYKSPDEADSLALAACEPPPESREDLSKYIPGVSLIGEIARR